MLGYSNPWALWVRKQCEIAPLAIQGVYDLALSMLVDVPFAKCICVDSRGANFQSYMTDNCYYFAPDHLKPLMLALIDNAVRDRGVETSCLAMVGYAKQGMSQSMQPWLDAQFAAAGALANSIDYLLSFVSPKGEAGRCTDFESNPYSTVLIPEPMDYFSACSATSVCEAKCRAGNLLLAFACLLCFISMHEKITTHKKQQSTGPSTASLHWRQPLATADPGPSKRLWRACSSRTSTKMPTCP